MRPEHWLYTIPLRLRSLFRFDRTEQELDDEIRFHLDQQIEENIANGMTPKEARSAALRSMEGLELHKEECRDTRRVSWIGDALYDVRFGARTLRKNPGFTAIAVLTLALGISASTVVFSVIYNGLLRPFPYQDASRLTTFSIQDLRNTHVSENGPDSRGALTGDQLIGFQQQSNSLQDIAGFMNADVFCENGEMTLHLQAAYVTSNTFQLLGVGPLLGRSIIPEDANRSAYPVFAMNYHLWQKRFNSDPKIVGTSFVIDGLPRTLVAIMPPRFQIDGDDIWIPSDPIPGDSGISKNAAEPNRVWWPLGRLRPGVNSRAASRDLTAIAERLAEISPSHLPPQFTTVVTRPYIDVVIGGFKSTLYALGGAVAMLLLITCTNFANLLMARGSTREKEIAIRASLGASRGRLIRQFLVETLSLATVGAVTGCLFAYWGIKGILAVIPAGTIPKEAVITLNPSVLIFASCVAALTALLCGLVVALYGLRGELNLRLTQTGKGAGLSRRGGKFRAGLVVAEIALATTLLVAAGLMMRTLLALTHIDLGFNPANILVTELSFPNGAFPTPEGKKVFLQQALQRIVSSPGVIAAASSISLPPYGGPGSDLEIPGQPDTRPSRVAMDLCSEGFFQTLGMHLLRGRLFAEADMASSAQRVAVVDEVLARRFFPASDPVGREIKFNVLDLIPDAPHGTYFKIIGVVGSIKNYGLRNPAIPQAYLPYTTFGTPGGNILVRSAGKPLSMAKEVHDSIESVDRDVSLTATSSLETYLQTFSYASPEFGFVTFGSFAGIGLLLVNVGIFGLMAYNVSAQTQEIGIRIALGAQQVSILKMILAAGSRLIAAGILIGLSASYGLTRFLSRQVWGVTTTDHGTFTAVAILAAFTGLAACYIPARRATRVDPMVALRNE
jgi:predicted permease